MFALTWPVDPGRPWEGLRGNGVPGHGPSLTTQTTPSPDPSATPASVPPGSTDIRYIVLSDLHLGDRDSIQPAVDPEESALDVREGRRSVPIDGKCVVQPLPTPISVCRSWCQHSDGTGLRPYAVRRRSRRSAAVTAGLEVCRSLRGGPGGPATSPFLCAALCANSAAQGRTRKNRAKLATSVRPDTAASYNTQTN